MSLSLPLSLSLSLSIYIYIYIYLYIYIYYIIYIYISATVPCAECVVMRLRDLETPSIHFLVFFLTLQTLYKYLPSLRTVLFS